MRSISSRGPIVFTYVLFWVREGILHFEKSIGFLKIFEPRKCFIVIGKRSVRRFFSLRNRAKITCGDGKA